MTRSSLILTLSILTTIVTANCAYLSLGPWRRVTVEQCEKRHFVQYGKTCLRVCPPKTHIFADDNKCYDSCPWMSILVDGECLNGSYCYQQNQVLVNGSCKDGCPAALPYKKDGYCYRECPKESIQSGTECIDANSCISNGFIFNKICVQKCPHNTTYSVNGVCQDSCPNGTVTTGNTTCLPVSVCRDKELVVYNKTCVPFCPSAAPYLANGECFQSCPESFVLVNSTDCISISECMMKWWHVFNGTCLSVCPTYTYQYTTVQDYFLHLCIASCPKGYVIHDDKCIQDSECTDALQLYSVVYNGSCLSGCPIEAPLNNNGYCTDVCPETTFEKDSLCIDNSLCKNHFDLEFKGECVRSCPKGAPKRQINRKGADLCVAQCPYGTVNDEKECVLSEECISKQKYVYNNTCYDSCPEYTYSHRDFHCYIKCPIETVAHNSECIPRKACQLISNEICVSTCPLSGRFVYKNICVTQCPSKTFANGTMCTELADCSGFVYNRTCVETCPAESPLVDGKKCVAKCPSGSEAFKDRNCVLLSKCKKFSNGSIIENKNTCLTKCPINVPYTYKFKNICLSKCPTHTIIHEVNCIDKYDCRGVRYKGRCMRSCPSEAPYKETKQCYNECPENMFRKGKRCYWHTDCPNVIFNKTCIYKGDCPIEARYRMDNMCLKVCPEGYFTKDDKCLLNSHCPTIIFNGTCIYSGDCPSEARYRKDNKCLKVCPDVIDVDGINCTYSYRCTSNGLYIIDGRACTVSCPAGYGHAGSLCIKQNKVRRGIVIVSVLILLTYSALYLLLHNPSETRHRNAVYTKIESEYNSDEATGSEERQGRRATPTKPQMELEELEDDSRTSIEICRPVSRETDDIQTLIEQGQSAHSKERRHLNGVPTDLSIDVKEHPLHERERMAIVEIHRQEPREDDVPLLEVIHVDEDFDNDALLFGNGCERDVHQLTSISKREIRYKNVKAKQH